MHNRIIFALLMLGGSILSTTNAQDTILVENVYRHELQNGKPTWNKQVVYQNTYTPQGRLIQRIDYSDSSAAATSFTFYFYTEFDSLLSVEKYNPNNEIVEIQRYSYTNQHLPATRVTYQRIDHQLIPVQSTQYVYQGSQRTGLTEFNQNSKMIHKSVLQKNNGTTTQSDKFSKQHPSGMKSQFTVWSTKDSHTLSKKVETTGYQSGNRVEVFEIENDSLTGQLTEIRAYNNTGDLTGRTVFLWNADGSPKIQKKLNATGLYLENLSFVRFEHVVFLGKHEMYRLNNE